MRVLPYQRPRVQAAAAVPVTRPRILERTAVNRSITPEIDDTVREALYPSIVRLVLRIAGHRVLGPGRHTLLDSYLTGLDRLPSRPTDRLRPATLRPLRYLRTLLHLAGMFNSPILFDPTSTRLLRESELSEEARDHPTLMLGATFRLHWLAIPRSARMIGDEAPKSVRRHLPSQPQAYKRGKGGHTIGLLIRLIRRQRRQAPLLVRLERTNAEPAPV